MDKVRWGVLSTARIGTEKMIPGLRRSTTGDLVAIASRSDASARTAAERLAIPRWHGSYDALLADPGVDAVYIPLPNHLHAEWSIAALRAGKHVLCEKPLAVSAEEAERMGRVAEASGRLLMEAFMYRHHPSWTALREVVASGRIGTLTAVDSWYSYHNDDPGNIRNIRAYGGGALLDIGCYCVNLSRMLFDAEPERVAAALVRDPGLGVDVLTSGTLVFGRGIASFTCSSRAERHQRVDVYGSRGRASLEIPFNIPPDRPSRMLVAAGGDPPVAPAVATIEFPPADPYACEADAFGRAVLDGSASPVAVADAVANLRVIERVFAAAEGAPG